MTEQMCGGCTRPVKGATLCTACTDVLGVLLKAVPKHVDNLRISITRQANYSQTGAPSSGGESPVPFNVAASATYARVVSTYRDWQGRVADHVRVPVRYPNPVAAAWWIHAALVGSKLNSFVDAGHMLAAFEELDEVILKAIDRPDDTWFAGKCSALIYRPDSEEPTECDQDLYAVSEKGDIECPKCSTRHDVGRRRELLLAHADTVLATASEAARAIVVWSDYERGENKLARRIVTWAERGRIEQHGTIRQDGRDRPLYRIGDVRALLLVEEAREAARSSAKTKEKA